MPDECANHELSTHDRAMAQEIARHVALHVDCPLGMTILHREALDGAIRWKAKAVATIAVTVIIAGVGTAISLLWLGVQAAVQIISKGQLNIK